MIQTALKPVAASLPVFHVPARCNPNQQRHLRLTTSLDRTQFSLIWGQTGKLGLQIVKGMLFISYKSIKHVFDMKEM